MSPMAVLLAAALFAADQSGDAQTAATSKQPRVEFETSLGTILVELDAERAPKTVENFIGYVRSGHFDGTIFHRVIRNFMIQGGGFDAEMRQKPVGEPIANEASNGLKNERGTLAMARTMDPHSATAQFFINTVNNRPLDYTRSTPEGWGYAVFGRVVEGMDVVDKIEAVQTTTRNRHGDVPVAPISIVHARIVE